MSIELDKDIQEPILKFVNNSFIKFKSHTGIRNASVFPEPVIAAPRISWPCNATPIASRWISVGVVKPAFIKPKIYLNEIKRLVKWVFSFYHQEFFDLTEDH